MDDEQKGQTTVKDRYFMRMYPHCRTESSNAVQYFSTTLSSSAYSLSILLCCFLFWSVVAQAAVTAHVDRFNISEGETVNLSIEVTGSDSGDPQTAPLQKDFEILSNNHSSSFSIVNGSTSSKSVYQLMLRPRHAGPLTIPAIKVGSAQTTPIMIQVSKIKARSSSSGLPTGDVWLSMDVSPKKLRVQQQAIITIRVYQAVGLNQAQLTEPKAEHAVIERLGDDASYQKQENGRAWQITERRYALFPQQSGHIEINPVQLDGSVLVGGASYFQTARPIRVRSNALNLDVSGIPDGWTGGDWLPAKQLKIEESWPQTGAKFKVGEPITRTLTLRANGLSSSQLPDFSHDLPDHLKSYADKPVLKDAKGADGVHGMRQEKTAIMPMHAGTYILPEIDITWWNTASEKTEHATLPARTFTVIAAATPITAPPATPTSTQPAKVLEQPVTMPIIASEGSVASWWQWLAIIACVGWLLTLAYLGYARQGRPRKENTGNEDTVSLKQTEKAVETACRNHDAKACEQALLQVARLKYPHGSINSLATLASLCSEKMRLEVSELEKILYASDASAWNGDALLQAFQHEIQQKNGFASEQDKHANKANALPGLYPD